MMLSLISLTLGIVTSVSPMTHWGRQFLVTFVPNYDQTGENAIYVTAHDPATVQVQNDLFNISSIFYVDQLSSVRIVVPTALYYNDTNAVQRKAVYVNATADISVYVVNYRINTTDMYTAYPLRAMGQEYVLALYPPTFPNLAYFVIAALYDATTVHVQFNVSSNGTCLGGMFRDGGVESVTLQSHDVWGGGCTKDLTGSNVTSDKPVTVLTGLKCDSVPVGVLFCDHMVEMMLPVEDYGYTYILHNITYRKSGVIYRVVSGHDGAVVTESTGGNVTLNKGEFKDYDIQNINSELCIISSKPVMTLMFTKGANSDLVSYGDPSMTVIPPVESYTSDYVINMEFMTTGITVLRYAAIIVKNDNTSGLVYPGKASFSPVGCGYSVGHVTLDNSTWWLRHTDGVPFGVVMYGFLLGSGIALPGGLQLLDKSECASGPCQNSAQCMINSRTGSFSCNCVAGFTGSLCEIEISTTLASILTTPGDQQTPYSTVFPPLTTNYNFHQTTDGTSEDTTAKPEPLTTETSPDVTTCSLPLTTFETSPNVIPSLQPLTTETLPDAKTQSQTLSSVDILVSTTYLSEQTTDASSVPSSTNSIVLTEYAPNTTQRETTWQTLLNALTTPDVKTVSPMASSPNETCLCACAGPHNNLTLNELWKQVQAQSEQLKIDLLLDKHHLSTTVRKLTSAPDYRPSARGIGYVGVLCLVMSFSVIVIMDATRMCRIIKDTKKKKSTP